MRQLLIVCLLCLYFPAIAQLRELRFNRLGVEDGMPENFATCHIQDKYGYHWFGTQNGLLRYDGYKMKMYNLETVEGWVPAYRSIWSLEEDEKGNIWIATAQEGIFRFDRTTEKCVQFKLPDGAPEAAQMFRLTIDKEGAVWVGSRTSKSKWHLDRLDPRTGKYTIYDSSGKDGNQIPSGVLNWGVLCKDGNYWVCGNHGLHRYDYKTKKFITVIQNDVRFVYEAPSEPGILWFNQKEGLKFLLTRYDTRTGAMEVYRRDAAIPGTIHNDSVSGIFESAAKDMWISTANGVSLFDRKNKTFKAYIPPNPFPEDPVSNLCIRIWEGKNGQLWIQTLQKGLLYLSSPTGTLKRYVYDENNTNGLPSNSILNASFVDNDYNLWLLTRSRGINRLDEKASQFEYVQKYNEQSKYPGGDLSAIADIDDQFALILSVKGLFKYNKKDSHYIPVEIPLAKASKANLNDVIVDRSGIAWISSSKGLYTYDTKTGSSRQYLNDPLDSTSLSNNVVRIICEDTKGNIWVGTIGGGLNRLDRETGIFTRYPFSIDQTGLDKGVLDDDQVQSIYEDRKGVLWIGTNNGGLNRYDPVTGKFKSYYKNGNAFQCITYMFEDSKGRFWVGTYLGGLYLLDRETGKTRRWTEKEGLAFDQVYGIKEDGQGRIWIASHRGFSILDGKDFSISYLNTSNGLPNNYNSAQYIYELGEDWVIGSRGGFIRFKPGELVKSDRAPRVLVQSIAFNRGRADSTILVFDQEEISLAYNENRLQFQFVGLHYSNSPLNQYQYKLEGYDLDWIKAGTQRNALYTNLSPGKYRFYVKAANSDGIWSEPTEIDIIIHPPWWKTWWAYTLYALLFILSLGAFIAYRSKQLRRENRVLEEKVEHRTIQLKKSIEELKTTQTQLVQSEKMASLGELTAGIAHEIQNPLNFINNFSEVSSELLHEMKEELAAGNTDDVKAIADDLNKNMEKIVYHGKRADSIVKNMLQHSRQSTGQKEPTDINALVDEYLRLSYHGLRAKDKSFNAIMETHFDPSIGKVPLVSQDMGRVLLNLFNNAFYSVVQKKKQEANGFQPMLFVTTEKIGGNVEIKVKDNGLGIPQKVLDKIYQPFFTTKPTGEGTGLGLSLSYDIITKGHAGEMKVKSQEGEGAEFSIILPYQN